MWRFLLLRGRGLATLLLFLCVMEEAGRKYVLDMPWPPAAECNMITNKQTGIQLNEWTEHEATQAMSAVRQVWQEQYKTQPSRPGSEIQRPNLDIEDEFTQWRRARYGVQIGRNILWIYIRMETAC